MYTDNITRANYQRNIKQKDISKRALSRSKSMPCLVSKHLQTHDVCLSRALSEPLTAIPLNMGQLFETHFKRRLSNAIPKNPIVSKTGHLYERHEIRSWLEVEYSCPKTRLELTPRDIFSCEQLHAICTYIHGTVPPGTLLQEKTLYKLLSRHKALFKNPVLIIESPSRQIPTGTIIDKKEAYHMSISNNHMIELQFLKNFITQLVRCSKNRITMFGFTINKKHHLQADSHKGRHQTRQKKTTQLPQKELPDCITYLRETLNLSTDSNYLCCF